MSSSTIHVKGLNGQSEKELRDFFSFCGKIESIKTTPENGENITEASVTFAKDSASRTAQLLDGTQLGKSTVSVTSAASLGDLAPEQHDENQHDGEVPQELKPRARVLAEYLASGYKVADAALTKSIELDSKHGVTSRFQAYLQQLDQKTQATARAQAVDGKLGVSKNLSNMWSGLNSYCNAALESRGNRLLDIYQTGFKNAQDIHQEALRLAGLQDKYAQGPDGTFKAEPVGDGKTHCGCGGSAGVCGCQEGRCTCANCPKKTSTSSGSGIGQNATGQVDTIAASANVAPLGEKK